MKRFLIAGVLLATPALAQQHPSAIDRVSGALGQCIATAEQKLDQIGDLQRQLAEAQAKIKTLEQKPEEKPEGK